MIGDGHGGPSPIFVLTQQGYVVAFSHNSKPEVFQGVDDLVAGSVHRELACHTATPVSATKTSSAEDVSSRTSGPKVSM